MQEIWNQGLGHWPHHICSQETGRQGCWRSTDFLFFMSSRSLNHGMTLPMFWVVLPTSSYLSLYNLSKAMPRRLSPNDSRSSQIDNQYYPSYYTQRRCFHTVWVNMDETDIKQQYHCSGHDCLETVFLALSRSFQREADLIQMKRGTWEMMFIGYFSLTLYLTVPLGTL